MRCGTHIFRTVVSSNDQAYGMVLTVSASVTPTDHGAGNHDGTIHLNRVGTFNGFEVHFASNIGPSLAVRLEEGLVDKEKSDS